ncbi:hypothetical protein [Phytohabitans rumicis]|uniref:hypothetical protein n=1 Tax=Phytohabitans rumicis TaxID=1076125 RepID=UPI0015653079|nr:hypothetical protein [Phytohabitans rumicis]
MTAGRRDVLVVGAQRPRAEPGEQVVVAPRLVRVAHLVDEPSQVVRQGQHQRMPVAVGASPRGLRLLQHPPRVAQLAERPVHGGEAARRGQDGDVVRPERHARLVVRAGQQVAGSRQVTGPSPGIGGPDGGGETFGCGHRRYAARSRPATPALAGSGRHPCLTPPPAASRPQDGRLRAGASPRRVAPSRPRALAAPRGLADQGFPRRSRANGRGSEIKARPYALDRRESP